MAAGDVTVASGTPIVWADDQDFSGTNNGFTQTKQMNLLSLADGDAHQGVKADLTATRAPSYTCMVCLVFAAQPDAGNLVHILWSSSYSDTAGTGNTGGTASTGTDADWDPTGATEADRLEYMHHLDYIGSVITVADDTRHVMCVNSRFVPPLRYGFPIVFNQSDEALDDSVVEMFIALIPNLENVAAS